MDTTHNTDTNTEALLGVYKELCTSYHATDDFRMNLLGLLPLTSLIGIFALNSESLFAQESDTSHQVISFIGIFAAAFTLSLFLYELRSIIRCHDLIERGKALERELNVLGQFDVCVEEHKGKNEGSKWKDRANYFVDAKLSACVIYSTVAAAWLFTAFRFGLEWTDYVCAFSALGVGLLIGVSAFFSCGGLSLLNRNRISRKRNPENTRLKSVHLCEGTRFLYMHELSRMSILVNCPSSFCSVLHEYSGCVTYGSKLK